jgi:hypothetical protein
MRFDVTASGNRDIALLLNLKASNPRSCYPNTDLVLPDSSENNRGARSFKHRPAHDFNSAYASSSLSCIQKLRWEQRLCQRLNSGNFRCHRKVVCSPGPLCLGCSRDPRVTPAAPSSSQRACRKPVVLLPQQSPALPL